MSRKRRTALVPEDEARDTAEAPSDQEQLAAGLQQLRDLLLWDRVEEARRFVKELEQRWPDAERVRHYAHVLALPVSRRLPGIKPKSLAREWKWLEEHAHEYPGCWLAVYEDRLIAAGPNRQVVLARVRETLGHENVLMFLQPGNLETP